MARQILVLILVAVGAYLAGRFGAPTVQVDTVLEPIGSDNTPFASRDALEPHNRLRSPSHETRAVAEASDDETLELEAAAQEMQRTASPARRKREIRSIYRRYAQIDPVAALTHAQALSDSFARRAGIEAVVESLSETDPDFALQLIENVDSKGIQISLRVIALRGMALRDPVRAVEAIEELPGSEYVYLDSVFRQWAAYAPRAAIEFANAHRNPQMRSLGRGIALANWAGTDPDEAIAWFESVRMSLNDDEKQNLALSLARAAPERSEAIGTFLKPEMRAMLAAERISNLAQKDPQAAAAQLSQTTNRAERSRIVSGIAASFAKRDRAAGFVWAETLMGNEKRIAQEQLYNAWMQSDADGALAHLDAMPAKQRHQMTETVLNALSNVDPARAFAWLKAQPGGTDNVQNVMHLAMNWAYKDANEALAAFAAHQDESWSRRALSTSLMQLAQTDPVRAQNWVMRLEDVGTRRASAQAVAANMAQSDPDGALKWARSLGSELRDSAVSGAVLTDNVAPKEAFDIVRTIDDPSLRLNTIEHLFYRTYQTNPELAREWVENAPFDASKRSSLLSLIPGQ